MFSLKEDEDIIVKWAIAEIVRHLRQNPSYNLKYLFSTRVHKILFKTFEEMDIPVTRSWFRYGCFIHSNELQTANLAQLINGYANIDNLGSRLGRHIGKLGIKLEDTESILWKNADRIAFLPMDNLLEELYDTAPLDFRHLFQAKLKLYNSLKDLKKIDLRNIEEYLNWLLHTRKNISSYHSSLFSICNPTFAETSHETFSLSEVMEEALIKGLILAERQKLNQNQIKMLRAFDEFFDEKIWCPFAYGISETTVTGLRAEEVRNQQKSNRIKFLKKSASLIQFLKASMLENELRMSWSDSIEWYKLHRNDDVEKRLAEIQKIYEHSTERA
jgi:hypothetical protein